jgi:hypothetical protein
MTNTPLLVGAMLVLAIGTYAFRLAGPALRSRVEFPPAVEKLMERPVGVLVGGLLAWRKAPFVVVVLGAAVCTALLRLVGVS